MVGGIESGSKNERKSKESLGGEDLLALACAYERCGAGPRGV